MAKQLSPEETRSLAAVFSQMRNDSEKAQARLEEMLATQDKGVRRLEKQFKKLRVTNLQEIKKQKKALKLLIDDWDRLTEAEKFEAQQLKRNIREHEKANSGINKLAANTAEAAENTSSLTSAFGRQISSITKYASAMGALTLTVQAVVALYKNWIEIQTQWAAAMGSASRQLGMTQRQFNAFRSDVERTRGAFAELQGDFRGIAEAANFWRDSLTALRMDSNRATADMQDQFIRIGLGFGLASEEATNLYRLLQTGMDGATGSLDDFGADMLHFAESIGANAGTLTRDFVGAQDAVAQFGSQGVETFRNAALMANEFGFETRRIFDMMRGFDTFSRASQNVNQLNALLGTTLSSYELMLEQDPAERLEMLRQGVNAVGTETLLNNRQAMQAMAQITGESEANLRRIFGEGSSLEQLRQQQEQAEADAQSNEQRQISNQRMMNDLLSRGALVYRTIWDRLGQIVDVVSESLTPVFEVIHEETMGLATEFRNWLRQVTQSGQAQQFIRNIANSIRDMVEWVRSVNWSQVWEDTKETWREWEPTVRTIGGMILRVLEFARDNPGIVAALFAGAAIARFAGILSQIPGAVSAISGLGGGAAMAGAAIPAAAIGGSYLAAQAAEQRRIEEGQRAASGDMATRQRLRRTGFQELQRRGEMFAGGDTQEAMRGGGDTNYLRLRQGLGMISGQEADQRRNNIQYIIDDIIRGGGEGNPSMLARRIRRQLPAEMISQLVRGGNGSPRFKSLEGYLESRFQAVAPRYGGRDALGVTPESQETGVGVTSPTSATESAPSTARTSGAANAQVAGSQTATFRIDNRINVDGREIARAIAERAIGERAI